MIESLLLSDNACQLVGCLLFELRSSHSGTLFARRIVLRTLCELSAASVPVDSDQP